MLKVILSIFMATLSRPSVALSSHWPLNSSRGLDPILVPMPLSTLRLSSMEATSPLTVVRALREASIAIEHYKVVVHLL